MIIAFLADIEQFDQWALLYALIMYLPIVKPLFWAAFLYRLDLARFEASETSRN
jgi:hypothetical protein